SFDYLPNLTHLYQDDPDWEDDPMAGCPHSPECTIGDVGCKLTSFTMSERYVNDNSHEPPYINTTFYSLSNPTQATCNMSLSNACSVFGINVEPQRGSYSEKIQFIIGSIDQGYPVILEVELSGLHYVVAYGYMIDSNGTHILIRDPEVDWDYTRLSTYINYGRTLNYCGKIY
ncbi:MAG: C39 family peptidase, partial [Acetanaerobacterium sp.]